MKFSSELLFLFRCIEEKWETHGITSHQVEWRVISKGCRDYWIKFRRSRIYNEESSQFDHMLCTHIVDVDNLRPLYLIDNVIVIAEYYGWLFVLFLLWKIVLYQKDVSEWRIQASFVDYKFYYTSNLFKSTLNCNEMTDWEIFLTFDKVTDVPIFKYNVLKYKNGYVRFLFKS